MRGENRGRLHREVMFDENSGSPADRPRERGRLSSAKIEARQRWAKGQKMRQKCWGGRAAVGRQRGWRRWRRSNQAGIAAPIKMGHQINKTPCVCPSMYV